MDTQLGLTILEIAGAIGAIATPIIVAVIAILYQRRQGMFESTMTERIKHLGVISPQLNLIFRYRQRLGDFLERAPDEILEAKRLADQEFWTFHYLWTGDFRKEYQAFMDESFETFLGEGERAKIRAESQYYPKPTITPNWVAFTNTPVDRKANQSAYDTLQRTIASDLGIRY